MEQLGANVSVSANLETFRMEIIESESASSSRKKRKTGLNSGNSRPDSPEEEFTVNGRCLCLMVMPRQAKVLWLQLVLSWGFS